MELEVKTNDKTVIYNIGDEEPTKEPTKLSLLDVITADDFEKLIPTQREWEMPLTEEEKLGLANQINELLTNKYEIENEKAVQNKTWNAKITDLDASIKVIHFEFTSGVRNCFGEVFAIKDLKAQKMLYFDTETYEYLSERELTEKELLTDEIDVYTIPTDLVDVTDEEE